jgi:aminomethyltransferase
MKETPLHSRHVALGAKMAEFAGYDMPIEYTGINDEHLTVRHGVGVFDVSHMGEIWVQGQQAVEFLQRVISNDATALADGGVQYSYFPNPTGGIIDDFLNYRLSPNRYLLVVNAANLEKDWAWLSQEAKRFDGVELQNSSLETGQLAVQGPLAMKVVQKLVDEPIEDLKYYTFKIVTLAGQPGVILSATGYTGAGGCEIYCKSEQLAHIWDALMEAGKPEGIKPAGLGARDTLRLEMGFCLYGHEINDETSPIEAGLGWVTKLKEGKDMIGKDPIAAVKAAGPRRKLVGFEMVDKGIPRQHYRILDAQGNPIGEVTSGTMSPCMKIGIGMGYVLKEHAAVEGEIFIEIRNKPLKAKVVKLPIYKGGK